MKVNQRLRINSIIMAFMIVTVLAVLIATTYLIDATIEQKKIADALITASFERLVLRTDYTRTGTDRAREQVRAKYREISELLKTAAREFTDPETRRIIASMDRENEAIGRIFLAMMANRERYFSHGRLSGVAREIEDRLIGQLNMRVYETVLLAGKLREATNQALFSTLRVTAGSLLALVVLVSAVSLINSVTISRSITERIERLRRGAAEIGGGNLDHVIALKGRDEFAELSAAFDEMSRRLRDSYRDLEREIGVRRSVQEDQKRLIEKLEAAVRELEGFTYSVSHDLRAPVRHINSYAYLLKKDAWPVLGGEGRHYLDTVLQASTSLGVLADQLLEFSRMSRTELKRSPADIDLIVRDVIAGFSGETRGRDIQWRIGPLPRVWGDPAMLRIVFQNLIGNSLKFTRTRPQAVIEIGYTSEEAAYCISVRDNGIGFNMQYHDKLFGVFERLHTAEEYEGTGIGLANAQRIIQRHGGSIRAEGKLNEGAVFYVVIPREGD